MQSFFGIFIQSIITSLNYLLSHKKCAFYTEKGKQRVQSDFFKMVASACERKKRTPLMRFLLESV